jgi:hypothetical protein
LKIIIFERDFDVVAFDSEFIIIAFVSDFDEVVFDDVFKIIAFAVPFFESAILQNVFFITLFFSTVK